MGSLSGVFSAASSALLADQTALTATADNISNQNTAGYVRRDVQWSEGDTVSIGSTSSPGVTATVVASRNNVLTRSVQQATESASSSSARSTALNNLQSLFTLNASGQDAAGISSAISSFFNSATTLAASPTDTTARQTLFSNAQALATTFNQAASQLSAQTTALNGRITSAINQVNSLATQVASINQQITLASSSTDTSALQDQRDQIVTQLSALVDVNTVSNSDGSISLSLSNGTPLVASSQALPFSTSVVNGNVHILANTGTTAGDITSAIAGGSIAGMLQVRDGDIPAVSAALDALAGSIASAVNTQNAAGTDANGNAGGAIFSGSTAATLTVSAASASAIAASPDGSNATAIGGLQNSAQINGGTFAQGLSTMISALGQAASTAQTTSTAAAAVLTQTQTQLDTTTGVDLDTEAANLTQYQRSYEAAAKVLSIVNELMAQAINLGTETTVS